MLYQDRIPRMSRISASEFKSMTEMLRAATRPALVSLTTPGLAFPTPVEDPPGTFSKLRCAPFAAGDFIITGGAGCTSYLDDTFNFATAGPTGGPLPAGTYTIYLRVDEAGLGAKEMRCWPCATTEASLIDVDDESDTEAKFTGMVDSTRYLVLLTGVTWDGTNVTNSAPWWAAAATAHAQTKTFWGALPLTALGKGTFSSIVIAGDRGLTFHEALGHALQLDELHITNNGVVDIGSGADIDIGTGADLDVAKGGNVAFADGTGTGDRSVDMTLGAYSKTTVKKDSEIDLFGTAVSLAKSLSTISEVEVGDDCRVYVRDGGKLQGEAGAEIAGDWDAVSGCDINLKSGAQITVESGAQITVGNTEPAGGMALGVLYAEQLCLAKCRVSALGSLLGTSFNIDSVSWNGTDNYYTITFKTPRTGYLIPVATMIADADGATDGRYIKIFDATSDGCKVKIFDELETGMQHEFALVVF